jgi:hypothetical protein
MRVKDVIFEAVWDEPVDEDRINPDGSITTTDDEAIMGDEFDHDFEQSMMRDRQPEMELSSNADQKMINAVRKVCDQYKGQGHAQVELLPFLTKVMEFVKKPVNLADLIAINKKSQEIQALVDTIDEKKVKFKNMSVKNEDPGKERANAQAKKASTVSGMAGRAMGK